MDKTNPKPSLMTYIAQPATLLVATDACFLIYAFLFNLIIHERSSRFSNTWQGKLVLYLFAIAICISLLWALFNLIRKKWFSGIITIVLLPMLFLFTAIMNSILWTLSTFIRFEVLGIGG